MDSVSSASMMVLWTARLVVLMAMPKEPSKVTPGMFRATSAESAPAMPSGAMRKRPVPSLTVTTPPRERPTSLMPRRMMRSPKTLVLCSMTKLPVILTPSTLRMAGLPPVPTSSRRKKGPAGRSTTTV